MNISATVHTDEIGKRRTHLLRHVRYELAKVDDLAVHVDDVGPVALRHDRSAPGRCGSRSFQETLRRRDQRLPCYRERTNARREQVLDC